jgi:hypothetical protein
MAVNFFSDSPSSLKEDCGRTLEGENQPHLNASVLLAEESAVQFSFRERLAIESDHEKRRRANCR